jgi:hypothetical protein
MRNIFFIAAIFFATIVACSGERKSPHETVKGKHVSVTYGRPYKKGRVIFGDLIKYGEVWRTGADEATEITFDKDVVFGDRPVKAGTYTLFTIPKPNEWTLILNSQLKQWGAYDYEKYKNKDVVRLTVPVKPTDSVVEQHTIRFTPDNKMIIEWDQSRVEVPVTAQVVGTSLEVGVTK